MDDDASFRAFSAPTGSAAVDHRGRSTGVIRLVRSLVPVAVQHPDSAARGGGQLRDRDVADGHHRDRPDESSRSAAIGGLAAICFRRARCRSGLCRRCWPPSPALGIGACAGVLANGFSIARTGISAFIITLASLSIFKGADLGITRAQPFYGIPESVKAFGNTTIAGADSLADRSRGAACCAGVWYLLNRQRIGRYMLAVGGNANAAELSGVSIARRPCSGRTALSGVLAALAGVMLVARLQLGQPSIGDDWLILSFAAPVIGGAALAGGHVSVSAPSSAWSPSPSSLRRW